MKHSEETETTETGTTPAPSETIDPTEVPVVSESEASPEPAAALEGYDLETLGKTWPAYIEEFSFNNPGATDEEMEQVRADWHQRQGLTLQGVAFDFPWLLSERPKAKAPAEA